MNRLFLVPNDTGQIESNLAAIQDHARQFSSFTFVYPVISRRSRGLSIGINLNPDKRCNFDCIYCEVDRLTPGTVSEVDLAQMRKELVAMIRFVHEGGLSAMPRFSQAPQLAQEIRDLAFSGDGEPTAIGNFAQCVQEVVSVKQAERLDHAKLVLITNSAGLDKADVQRGLELLDANQGEIWAKLDAGTDAYYQQVNRSTVRFDRILHNLLATARRRPIVIQSLFLKINGQPISQLELETYCSRLNEIVNSGGQIKEVHAYTVARPTPETFATKLNPLELSALAQIIREKTALSVLTFS